MFGTWLKLGLIYFTILGPGWTIKMVPKLGLKLKLKLVAVAVALLVVVTAAGITLDELSPQMD